MHWVQRAVKVCGSQSALARALGVSRQAVSNWTAGAIPGWDVAQRVHEVTQGKVPVWMVRPDVYPKSYWEEQ